MSMDGFIFAKTRTTSMKRTDIFDGNTDRVNTISFSQRSESEMPIARGLAINLLHVDASLTCIEDTHNIYCRNRTNHEWSCS